MLSVEELLEKLNFALEKGYITKNHILGITTENETFIIENICLPPVILEEKAFKKANILFTKK